MSAPGATATLFPPMSKPQAGFMLAGIALGAFVAALFAVCAFAQKPNFSGTWKLNVSKSDFGRLPAPESPPGPAIRTCGRGSRGRVNGPFGMA